MQGSFKKVTFKANQIIFTEGRKGDAAYLILAGKVEIRMRSLSDAPQRIATLGRGDVFGELALIDDHPHMATAIAIQDTELSAISKKELNNRVDDMDPIMRGLLEQMVKRARETAQELVHTRTPAP